MNSGSILSLLLSFVLLIIGLNWFFNPLSAANSLNMNLFDGYGLNTQIRDFTSLFLATSILCFISFITRQYQWIFASGIIFLTITILHIIVSLFYEAPISVTSLIAEIIFFVIAFVASYYFKFKDT